MVLPRLLTALVLAPVFVWVLYLGGPPFGLFVFLMIGFGLWEFLRMAEQGGYPTQSWVGWGAGALVGLSLLFPGIRPGDPLPSQAPALAFMASLLVLVAREMFRSDRGHSMLRLAMSLAGIGLIVGPLAYFALLRALRGDTPELYAAGRQAAFFLVAAIWVGDSAAYGLGALFGRHRLAPAISPQKSWEGSLAGLAGSMGAGLAVREIMAPALFTRWEALAVAAAVGALAQVSDLTESLMKRSFGVKDSSQLLPGHGGVLDRFDSFLLAAPFLYFFLILSGRAG
jgi:phosphatidate cytidylyltransferase